MECRSLSLPYLCWKEVFCLAPSKEDWMSEMKEWLADRPIFLSSRVQLALPGVRMMGQLHSICLI